MSERQSNEAPYIGSEGELTNPADEAIVADTGAVTGSGIYEILALVSASANSQVKMARRNAANSADVGTVVGGLYVPANQTVPFVWKFFLDKTERVVLRMDDAQGAGTVWGSINAQRIG